MDRRLLVLASGTFATGTDGFVVAGVLPQGGRLYRRDDDSRSESYADILSRAGLAEIEGHGSAGGDPFAP